MSNETTTAVSLLARLNAGEITSEEIVRSLLERAQRAKRLNVFVHLDPERVLAQARAIDARRKAGEPLGRLAGVPVAIKDVLCVEGEPTTCGSRMLANFRPPYDATVIAKLRAAGAILFGKTNMDEFAMGSSTENSAYGPTLNPWDETRVPGGSSGGSAAAVAAGLAPLALGTDTGGSIRQPAAFCGVVGLKPTYGRVSRYGLIAFASSLDQIGPFAHDLADTALLLSVIAGRDPARLDQRRRAHPRLSVDAGHAAGIAARRRRPRVLRRGARPRGRQPPCRRRSGSMRRPGRPSRRSRCRTPSTACRRITSSRRRNARATSPATTARPTATAPRTSPRNIPARKSLPPLVRMMMASRAEGFGAEVKRRIMLGTFALSAGYADQYYNKALQVRRKIRGDFDAAFQEVDVLLGPTSPTPAFKLGERTADPLAMYLSDIYTITANLAGIPGISIPCGLTRDNLPIGLQLLAAPFAEEKLLRTARVFERATDWHLKRPRLV